MATLSQSDYKQNQSSLIKPLSQWTHKNNPSLILTIKEVHPTLVVGEVCWNNWNEDSDCQTLSLPFQGLLEMWSPINGNYNQTRVS